MQAYRLDLKSGQARLLTEAENLDPACLALVGDERSFCYVDGGRLYSSGLTTLRPRQVYQAAEGFKVTAMNIADDGLFAALVEQKGAHYRLQSIRMMDGSATVLAEADEMSDPLPRRYHCSARRGRRSLAIWTPNGTIACKLADGRFLRYLDRTVKASCI
jgi:hypothetical protein